MSAPAALLLEGSTTRVCYFGTYERDYPGNRALIQGLRRQGVEVVECHVPLWERTRQKDESYFGLCSLLQLGAKYVLSCLTLSWRVLHLGRFDALIVGFNGHIDVLLARCVASLRHTPLLFNPMLSMYDTLVIDRHYFGRRSWQARLLLGLERLLLRLPDAILLDSREHFRFFHETLGVPWSKYRQLYFGADDTLFYPRPARQSDGRFRVLFYGKFQPLQGVEHVIQAAHLLREHDEIVFKIVGRGPDYARVRQLAAELGTTNVEFVDWVEPRDLPLEIAAADVCLGIFGTTDKVRRCIANKVIQALAMAKPVVTGATPASEELLADGQEVLFCPPGSAQGIAAAILRLRDDAALRSRLCEGGYRLFRERCAPTVVGAKAARYLVELTGRGGCEATGERITA